MDFLGIGPLELVAILVIALIVLGPKDMVKAGRTIGRTLRLIVSSDTWRVVQQASREIRNLPNRMIREAGMEDLQRQLPNQNAISKELGLDELNQSLNQDLSADLSPWTTPPPKIAPPGIQSSEAQPEAEPALDAGAWAEPPDPDEALAQQASEPLQTDAPQGDEQEVASNSNESRRSEPD